MNTLEETFGSGVSLNDNQKGRSGGSLVGEMAPGGGCISLLYKPIHRAKDSGECGLNLEQSTGGSTVRINDTKCFSN